MKGYPLFNIVFFGANCRNQDFEPWMGLCPFPFVELGIPRNCRYRVGHPHYVSSS